MLYQQFFATIHDSLDLPYRHINCFCKPFISQTVKQTELQNLPVTLGKHPFVNQIFPLGTALAEIFCFHRLPLFDFSQSVAPWAFLILGRRACFAGTCFCYFNFNLLPHSLHLLHRLYLHRYRLALHLSLYSQPFQTGFHTQANINWL